MKNFNLAYSFPTIFLLSLFASPMTLAADECVPPQSVLCILSAECEPDGNGYYELSTTLQRVTTIKVQDNVGYPCQVKIKAAPAVFAKLKDEAGQLKAAGVCVLVIDNISP